MKLGFITSILDTYTYEEVIDFASAHGFECYNLAGGAAFAAHVHPELFVR